MTLLVEETANKLEPRLLSDFLALTEACVVAAKNIDLSWDLNDQFPEGASASFHRINPLEWNAYFDRRAPELISIESISRNSPLQIALSCSVVLLSIAVVFSGGTIKATKDGFEATIPPLGDAIASLKKALGLAGHVTAGYSIRTITIKLNSTEVAALQLQDPSQQRKGGFQSFLIGLQSRLNKNTKELTLTDVDLERVVRYKSNPKKGGFQSRFEKIFGRHFPSS